MSLRFKVKRKEKRLFLYASISEFWRRYAEQKEIQGAHWLLQCSVPQASA